MMEIEEGEGEGGENLHPQFTLDEDEEEQGYFGAPRFQPEPPLPPPPPNDSNNDVFQADIDGFQVFMQTVQQLHPEQCCITPSSSSTTLVRMNWRTEELQSYFEPYKDSIRLVPATTHCFKGLVDQLMIVSHYLPIIVPISPLVVALKSIGPQQSKSEYAGYIDAISCLRQLHFFKKFFTEVDSRFDKKTQGVLAKRVYQDTTRKADTIFINAVEALKDGGGTEQEHVQRFIVALEQFTIQRIQCLEWNIMDYLGIPCSTHIRAQLLTPSPLLGIEQGRGLPDLLDSGLTPSAYSTLRGNLCWLLHAKNQVFTANGTLNLEGLEERMLKPQLWGGSYKGYITYATIKNYMDHLLSI